MTSEEFLQQFGHFIDAPNGIQKLRELILSLGLQGKLVPHNDAEPPVSDLFETINIRQEQLLEEGLIKKGKSLPPISDKDIKHLPKAWRAARLAEITGFNIGRTPPTKESRYWDDVGIPWVSISDLVDKGHVSSTTKCVTKEAQAKIFNQPPFRAGTILVSFKLTIGKISILDIDAYHNEAIASLIPYADEMQKFLFIFLPQLMQGGETKNAIKGKTLNSTSLKELVVPVPPLAEQHRIVAKVNELMALCDQLEAERKARAATHQRLIRAVHHPLTEAADTKATQTAWHRIRDNFADLYTTLESVQALRQTILQLAVQGKLVEQDANDEPAAVLLKKIANEKEQLIADGKVKKAKPLPPLDASNAPFSLPSGWEWARFPELGEFGRGKSKHRPRNDPTLYSNGTIPLVQTGDVARANGLITTCTAYYNEKGLEQSRLWPAGTMCITIAANIADTGILSEDACFPDSVVGFIPSSLIGNTQYFEYFTRTAKEHLLDFAPSTAQKNINLSILETVLIPVPPANELGRIVAKVDELMTLCDQLEANIRDKNDTAIRYAEAIVQQIAAA